MKITFLRILSAALAGTVPEVAPLVIEEQSDILKLAELHRVLPLVYDSMHTCGIALPQSTPVHKQVRMLVSQQALRTLAFTETYRTLSQQGVTPVVVKGIICRNLYPKPDFRISSDEDLLISPAEYPLCRKLLGDMGFSPVKERSPEHYQHSFVRDDGVHLELHTSLFATQDPFFDKWNREFEGWKDKTVTVSAEGTEFLTLNPTEHLLYLLLHALKHFIHSGVGIRQVCDIVVFANNHFEEIHWQKLSDRCKALGALKFSMGIFAIGKKHLNLSPQVSCRISQCAPFPQKEDSLLEDILSAGIYGSATLSRQHSSSITFSEVKNKNKGFLRRIFPPAKSLGGKYSYAKNSPLLLPIAWGHRLLRYRKELKNTDNNSPLETVQIGKQRLKLLKEYGLTSLK